MKELEPLESRGHLLTEQSNPNSQELDRLSSLELVDLFVQEDARVLEAIAACREAIAQGIDVTAESLARGGRLLYIGAGTSGRLGVLDAAECPPTFCTPGAGTGHFSRGEAALVRSSEALEDRAEDGALAMAEREVTAKDVVVGISAGGTTPYVQGAIAEPVNEGPPPYLSPVCRLSKSPVRRI